MISEKSKSYQITMRSSVILVVLCALLSSAFATGGTFCSTPNCFVPQTHGGCFHLTNVKNQHLPKVESIFEVVSNGNLQGYDSPTMTIQECQEICFNSGALYAGIGNGTTCACTNNIDQFGGSAIDPANCQQACAGDSTQNCGGAPLSEYWSIYSADDNIRQDWADLYTSAYQGTFTPSSIPSFAPTSVDPDTLTIASCARACLSDGYHNILMVEGNCNCAAAVNFLGRVGVDALGNWGCAGNFFQNCHNAVYNAGIVLQINDTYCGIEGGLQEYSRSASKRSSNSIDIVANAQEKRTTDNPCGGINATGSRPTRTVSVVTTCGGVVPGDNIIGRG
eukprot:TRINITY_DN1342_c0_g1_i1.p1 TRINITY_DN1342_c0_g1~~TRINITY_DN1342_c0_g1_i1.p1  ORF type:complete len:336 (+),score=58.82 TRINITY_DN1342_c0_g1_i1:68-1075(+)